MYSDGGDMEKTEFRAVKGLNEDSFGYDFVTYKWKGARKTGTLAYEMVELVGEEGIKAHQIAIQNKVLLPEDVTGTGDIAAPPGVVYMSPGMGTEKPKAKKKRKKGEKVIFGDQDK
jgi:hypothetical protein